MQVKNSKFSPLWIAFPMAALVVYILRVNMDGTEIKAVIPAFNLLSAYIVMIILEFTFKYKKRVSQKKFLPRDIMSTLIHTFFTGKVGSFFFIPAVAVTINSVFGRGLVFASPADAGPF